MSVKKSTMQRRSFLKMGMTGLVGLSAGPVIAQDKQKEKGEKRKENRKMIYRTLGKTGFKLPIVSMGVMNADNPNLVAAALDAGIVHLDTAWVYQRGRNEEMIGKVIKGRPRESFVIGTKVPGRPRDKKTRFFTSETDPKLFHQMFDKSLERLGIEYVDILYLHGPRRREDTLFEPLLKALEDEKKKGRTKFVGLSTHSNEPEVIQAAIDSKVYDVVLTAYNFRKDYREELKAAVAKAAKAGLGIVAMKTQGGVYWDKEKTEPINMKAALKWALNDPNIHTAIPGFTTFDQMELDLSVMEDLSLTKEEISDLKLETQTGGLYCQQCDRCLPQCQQKLPVPDLMRSYMYAYGYKNLDAAHDLIGSLDLPKDPCGSCRACSVQCVKAFDIKNRVQDIYRLREVPADFVA